MCLFVCFLTILMSEHQSILAPVLFKKSQPGQMFLKAGMLVFEKSEQNPTIKHFIFSSNKHLENPVPVRSFLAYSGVKQD